MSGPPVGSKIPGPFEAFNINGEKAGEEDCLFCRYGNSSVAMIFATKPSEAVAALLEPIEKGAAEAMSINHNNVGVCFVVTDSNAEIKSSLTKLAGKANYKSRGSRND